MGAHVKKNEEMKNQPRRGSIQQCQIKPNNDKTTRQTNRLHKMETEIKNIIRSSFALVETFNKINALKQTRNVRFRQPAIQLMFNSSKHDIWVRQFTETGSYIKVFQVKLITQTTKLIKISCTKVETKGVREGSKDFNHIPPTHKSGEFFVKNRLSVKLVCTLKLTVVSEQSR